MEQQQSSDDAIISASMCTFPYVLIGAYLEVIILGACIFSLRVRCCSELQSARVDVEASMLCGERGRYKLVILRPGEKYNYC